MLCFEPTQREVAVAVNGREQIVEVVCDAAGELADSFHLLRLTELLFSLTLLFEKADVLNHVGGEVSSHAHGRLMLASVRARLVTLHLNRADDASHHSHWR